MLQPIIAILRMDNEMKSPYFNTLLVLGLLRWCVDGFVMARWNETRANAYLEASYLMLDRCSNVAGMFTRQSISVDTVVLRYLGRHT